MRNDALDSCGSVLPRSAFKKELAIQLQGVPLAGSLLLLALSGTLSTFDLKHVFPHAAPFSDKAWWGTWAWPFLPNLGLLQRAIFALQFHVGLAETVRSALRSEDSSASSASSPSSLHRCQVCVMVLIQSVPNPASSPLSSLTSITPPNF